RVRFPGLSLAGSAMFAWESPFVLEDQVEFVNDLVGLAVGPAGRQRNVEEQFLEGTLLLVGSAIKRGRLAEFPLHVAAVVAKQLVANGTDVFRDIQRDG